MQTLSAVVHFFKVKSKISYATDKQQSIAFLEFVGNTVWRVNPHTIFARRNGK
jgi:hypothetical protein